MKVSPDARVWSNEPSLAVTVWVAESWLVQVTVLFTPMTTVIEPGSNEKFWMLTVAVDAARTGAPSDVDITNAASRVAIRRADAAAPLLR